MSRTAAILGLAACLMAPLGAQAAPVKTIDGVVIITQADALAGGVTPGDAPGYPITISAAGSYRLGGPLSVTNAAHGFAVNAPLVTLDFNGFVLDGNGVGSFGIYGVARSLTVKNGTVRHFTVSGVVSDKVEAVVSNMRIANVGDGGIVIFNLTSSPADLGTGRAVLTGNVIVNSGYNGLYSDATACLIKGNVISNSAGSGIWIAGSTAGSASTILDNVISGSQDVGIYLDGSAAGLGRNTLVNNTSGGNPAPIGGPGIPGSLGPNACIPLPNPVPAGC